MANPPQQEDFPTIKLDEEDRRSYQQKKSQQNTKPTSPDSGSTVNTAVSEPVQTKRGFPITATLALLFSLAALGGGFYLFQQSEIRYNEALAAEARLAQLEKKLSATGEEMGESTVALQIKVTELTGRTAELWEQMDKLWASAWRRNQKEIAELGAKITDFDELVKQTNKGVDDSIAQFNRNLSEKQAQLTGFNNELSSLANELLALNVRLEQADESNQQASQNTKNLTEQMAVLRQRNDALSGRITQLETEIKQMATKLISSSASASSPESTAQVLSPASP